MQQYFTLFETAIGTCGLVWQSKCVIGMQLPEANEVAARKRLIARFPLAKEHAPTPFVRSVIRKVVALMKGRKVDLFEVPLDMTQVPPFHQKVYAIVRKIPAGSTLSYGEVAAQVGSPGASRAVGQAMGRNPFPIIMPCHRVLAANGKLGGFTASGGTDTKQRMLMIEGVNDLLTRSNQKKLSVKTGSFPYSVRKAVTHLRTADAVLARLIRQVGPFRMTINQTQDVFLALAESIVYQQLHGKAAATIFKRVCDLFPRSGGHFTARDICRCSDERLRGAGLSLNKMLALRDLAAKTLDGTLPAMSELALLDDEAIIERLSAVRGIGRWTVEMLLMFRLGRPDVLPVDDYGVRKGFMLAYNKPAMPSPRELKSYGQRWVPYRSVASWYLWRAADQAKSGK